MNIEKLLFQSQNKFLDNHHAINHLYANKGLIPIHVKPEDTGKVIWLDVGDYLFMEEKFISSLNKIVTECSSPQTLETNLDLLLSDALLSEVIYPTGFIFFVHRCGSTLLAKALAQSRNHIVINEATALQEGLWSYLSQNWSSSISVTPENLNIIRNLILAMGRRRTTDQKSYFVKFHPWHSVFRDVIISAFPDVPCLFLYRDIAETLVSVSQVPAPIMSNIRGTKFASFLTGLSAEKTREMSDVEYFAKLYSQFMLAALNSSASNMVYLNYNQLTKQNFAKILRHAFHYTISEEQIVLMQSQFDYYSKDNRGATRFVSDTEKKQREATSEIREAVTPKLATLYAQLEQSDKNMVKWL